MSESTLIVNSANIVQNPRSVDSPLVKNEMHLIAINEMHIKQTMRLWLMFCCRSRPTDVATTATLSTSSISTEPINTVSTINAVSSAPSLQLPLEPWQQDGTDIGWKDAIPYVAPIVGGRVIKCYDGDTITIAAKLPMPDSPLYRFSVRLNGIDTPEMKGKTEGEKQIARLAQQYVESQVLNRYVVLKNTCTEKYGRVLADVYIDERHLNAELLEKQLALPYSGGKKAKIDWVQYHTSGIKIYLPDESDDDEPKDNKPKAKNTKAKNTKAKANNLTNISQN